MTTKNDPTVQKYAQNHLKLVPNRSAHHFDSNDA